MMVSESNVLLLSPFEWISKKTDIITPEFCTYQAVFVRAKFHHDQTDTSEFQFDFRFGQNSVIGTGGMLNYDMLEAVSWLGSRQLLSMGDGLENTVKSLIQMTPNPKTQMFLISACSCLCAIYWSQVLNGEWRCSWSSADRRCFNYIWVINNLIAY